MDRASNVKRAGLVLAMVTPASDKIRKAIRRLLVVNNEVEFEAVIHGLENAYELGVRKVFSKRDIHVVVNQLKGGLGKKGTYAGVFGKSGVTSEVVPKVGDHTSPKEKKMEAEALACFATMMDIGQYSLDDVIQLMHSTLGGKKVNKTSLVWDSCNSLVEDMEKGMLLKDKMASRKLRM